MVFRGKPSKACKRCRVRRLRCDLHNSACGQCVRANVICSGYRDTQQLRIQNESLAVVRKAHRNVPPFEPQSLPLSVNLQAREAFFAYYISGTCWDFLRQYCHPTDSPDHLTLTIEAISLAYLWHQVYSAAALAAARERYISALRMTNKMLKSSEEATKDTTLLASLLLDLFEKITDTEPRDNRSWTSHVNGALALVRLRGLEQFKDPSDFRVLLRLSSNYITSCVVSGSSVPDELIAIKDYGIKHIDAQDPRVRLLDVMVQYANLRSQIQRGILSDDEFVRLSLELDSNLQAVDLNMPLSWQYKTTPLDRKSQMTFGLHFDSYPHRNICQARNVLRLMRILLNESLIEHYFTPLTSAEDSALIRTAYENIEVLVDEICASVPQYVDCDGAARKRLFTSKKSELLDQASEHILDDVPGEVIHPHTPQHKAACYALIFPLYVAGRFNVVPEVKPWVIKQLHYIGSHFFIRNAEIVAQILEQGTDASPWEVYAMLGSYAFFA